MKCRDFAVPAVVVVARRVVVVSVVFAVPVVVVALRVVGVGVKVVVVISVPVDVPPELNKICNSIKKYFIG
jgi:hypothetical protein